MDKSLQPYSPLIKGSSDPQTFPAILLFQIAIMGCSGGGGGNYTYNLASVHPIAARYNNIIKNGCCIDEKVHYLWVNFEEPGQVSITFLNTSVTCWNGRPSLSLAGAHPSHADDQTHT